MHFSLKLDLGVIPNLISLFLCVRPHAGVHLLFVEILTPLPLISVFSPVQARPRLEFIEIFIGLFINEPAPNRFKLSNRVSVIQTLFVSLNQESQQSKAIAAKQKSDN